MQLRTHISVCVLRMCVYTPIGVCIERMQDRGVWFAHPAHIPGLARVCVRATLFARKTSSVRVRRPHFRAPTILDRVSIGSAQTVHAMGVHVLGGHPICSHAARCARTTWYTGSRADVDIPPLRWLFKAHTPALFHTHANTGNAVREQTRS